jgi:hypothetical protein
MLHLRVIYIHSTTRRLSQLYVPRQLLYQTRQISNKLRVKSEIQLKVLGRMACHIPSPYFVCKFPDVVKHKGYLKCIMQ